MTEAEAYRSIGWPLSGEGLVLPLSGGDRIDYISVRCLNCGGTGVYLPEAIIQDSGCPLCGSGNLLAGAQF